jgi:hypothetical protein
VGFYIIFIKYLPEKIKNTTICIHMKMTTRLKIPVKFHTKKKGMINVLFLIHSSVSGKDNIRTKVIPLDVDFIYSVFMLIKALFHYVC